LGSIRIEPREGGVLEAEISEITGRNTGAAVTFGVAI
jgi:hypothetical protein